MAATLGNKNYLYEYTGRNDIEQREFIGKNLYFTMQGASPEKWQLEACEFTMSRFAGLYGFNYKGMICCNRSEK